MHHDLATPSPTAGPTPSPTPVPTPEATIAAGSSKVVIPSSLGGYTKQSFTDGPQFAYRSAFAQELNAVNVSSIIISSVVDSATRRLREKRRLQAAFGITFDTQVAAANITHAESIKNTSANMQPSAMVSNFVSQLSAVKASGAYIDVPQSYVIPANVSVSFSAPYVATETAAPTPLPAPSCGLLRVISLNACALDVNANTDLNGALSTITDSRIENVSIYFQPGKFTTSETLDLRRTFSSELICNSTGSASCIFELDKDHETDNTLVQAEYNSLAVTGMHLQHACIGISAQHMSQLLVTDTILTNIAPNETATKNYCKIVSVTGSGVRMNNVTGALIKGCNISKSYTGIDMNNVKDSVVQETSVESTHNYATMISGQSSNVVFHECAIKQAKNVGVYMSDVHDINFVSCVFENNWNSALYARKSDRLTVESCGFYGNNFMTTNANNLNPVYSEATVWMHELSTRSYDNSFLMNMTNNVIDISSFQTQSDNIAIAYKQSTYESSSDGLFSTVRNGMTLVGGAEYDDVLFTLMFNNTVVCRECTDSYMIYYSNDPTYSNTFVTPLQITPGNNEETPPTEEGTFFTTQNSLLLAGGTTVAVVVGANANY